MDTEYISKINGRPLKDTEARQDIGEILQEIDGIQDEIHNAKSQTQTNYSDISNLKLQVQQNDEDIEELINRVDNLEDAPSGGSGSITYANEELTITLG